MRAISPVYTRHSSRIYPRIVTHCLQNATIGLEQWFAKWRKGISAEKSTALLFHKRRVARPHGNASFGESLVPWANGAKYFGVLLDFSLNFSEHIRKATHKAYISFSQLYPLLSKDISLSLSNQVLLYKTMIRSVLTYAGPPWVTRRSATGQ